MTAIKPTIFLIKQNITDPKLIFKTVGLKVIEHDDTLLYYRSSKQTIPDWAYFLNENYQADKKHFTNKSSYSVLLLKVKGRMMAIPFGMGIHLLNLSYTEYNFGLRTGINCIPKEQIRQIDTTTPETNSQKTKKQAVVGSTPEEFGINKEKDILRGITGKVPAGLEIGEGLDGKDSLRLGKSVHTISELKKLCEKALDVYNSDAYKKDYPWIDNIALVRDKLLISKLEGELVKSLKKALFDNMAFLPPVYYENIFDTKGFVFSSGDRTKLKNKDSYEMPSMNDWKKSLGNERKKITVDNLDNYKVHLIGEDDLKSGSWPLERCLAWETEFNGEKYILSEGSWYSVAPNFYKGVTEYYDARVNTTYSLPIPSKSKIKESDYNEEISHSGTGKYLFDLGNPKSKSKSIGKDGNEVCDVYDADERVFIHVKMGKTSSSISHLLRQGSFSGQILKQDEDMLAEFIKHLTDYGCTGTVIPVPYTASNYKILYVVVIGKKQRKDIPFFSKVSFKDVSERTLELMGYKCEFAYVYLP